MGEGSKRASSAFLGLLALGLNRRKKKPEIEGLQVVFPTWKALVLERERAALCYTDFWSIKAVVARPAQSNVLQGACCGESGMERKVGPSIMDCLGCG